jgi:hypothetical protein
LRERHRGDHRRSGQRRDELPVERRALPAAEPDAGRPA